MKALHVQARSAGFKFYPARAAVADAQVPWDTVWPDYAPTRYTWQGVIDQDSTVKAGGWADPADPTKVDFSTRISYEGALKFDVGGMPVNPRGRTGMTERGYLGKWGANHAADPIVTRFNPTGGALQVVCIIRRDTGVVALPGGMVDAGESVSVTVRREFMEEAVNTPGEAERAEATQLVETLFGGGGAEMYRGYVDDVRNTDNAWMETSAIHFHCENAVAKLQLHAGDDAAHAFWLDVDGSNEQYAGMFPDHKTWVDRAAATLRNK